MDELLAMLSLTVLQLNALIHLTEAGEIRDHTGNA